VVQGRQETSALTREKPTGVRLIVAYKTTKAVLQLAASAFLLYGARHGLQAALAEFADRLREHAVHSWSDVVARAIARLANARHSLSWAAAALAGDAVVSAFEGWALARGFRWAPWLIVTATACLLPFELYALVRHPRVGRLVIFMINLAIAAYLASRARRERARSGEAQAAS
jgi:uncharacterized membrane protein (DUF2068 family)